MKRLFLALALTLGMLGCKSAEKPEKPQQLRPAIALQQKIPKPKKSQTSIKDMRQMLETILEEHDVKYIDSVYFYRTENKKELFEVMRKKYHYDDSTIRLYEQALDARQQHYGLLAMLPRDRTGTGQSSLLCLFAGMAKYVLTKEDLESEIVHYAGHLAKDNAEGITLCGKKIGLEEINMIGPVLYQDILIFRARTRQVQEISKNNSRYSRKFRETMYVKYLSVGLQLGFTITNLELMRKKAEKEGRTTDPRLTQVYAYLQDLVLQAEQVLQVKEVDKK